MYNTLQFLETLPWALGVLLMVAAFASLSIICVLIVRRFTSTKTLRAHHDVAGFVFTNIGVLYSVLLGFTVVNVQQRFDRIDEIIQLEASHLAELYQDAEVFPEKNRTAVRQAIIYYGEQVIEEEWAALRLGKVNDSTQLATHQIWNAFYDYTPESRKQELWYAESISKLNDLTKIRMKRFTEGNASLSDEMWTLLIIGGLSMCIFMSFFGMESLTIHMLMAIIISSTTAFLLFLIYSLDSAFSGAVSISPEAIQNVLHTFSTLDKL